MPHHVRTEGVDKAQVINHCIEEMCMRVCVCKTTSLCPWSWLPFEELLLLSYGRGEVR